MSKQLSDAEEQAVAWAIRADAPDFMDWAALEAWLAADPRHAVLFDRAASAADAAAKAIAATPARDRLTLVRNAGAGPAAAPARPARRFWLPIGLAASFSALAMGTAWLLQPDATPPQQIVATRPGEVRTVALGDASTVTLNGDSEVRFAATSPRKLTLARGQASFQVRHDAAHPFTVTVGDVEVTDLGTRFDIDRTPGRTVVAVAEGAVTLRAGTGLVELHAGQRSVVTAGGVPGAPSALPPEDVSSWQHATLTYDDATLARVISDVKRRTGIPLRLAPGLADRHFAGSLNLSGSAESVIGRLEALFAVAAQRDGDGWTLGPRPPGDHQ